MAKFACETLGIFCVLLSKYMFNVYFDFIEFRNSIISKKCSTYILILSNLGIPLYLKKKKDEKIEREIKQYESIRDF